MPIHVYNLLLRAVLAVPTALGSTWLGLLFPLWGFLLAQLIILLLDGWNKMNTHWKQNVVRGFFVAVAAWASLFVWCLIKTAYTDHVGLVSRVGALRRIVDTDAQNKLNAVAAVRQDIGLQLSGLQQSCAEMKGANGVLTKQTIDQQETINNCQTQALKLLTPEEEKLTVLTWEDKANNTEHEASYLLITNKVVTPVNITGSCDVPLSAISAIPLSHVAGGGYSGGARIIPSNRPYVPLFYGAQLGSEFSIGFSTPAWSPNSPIRMDVSYISTRTATCKFTVR
jgi:hypothetical protein